MDMSEKSKCLTGGEQAPASRFSTSSSIESLDDTMTTNGGDELDGTRSRSLQSHPGNCFLFTYL